MMSAMKNKMMATTIKWQGLSYILAIVLLASCGGARDSSTEGVGSYDETASEPDCNASTCLIPYAKQNLFYEVDTISPGAGDVLSAIGLPSWASFDAGTGKISGYPPDVTSYSGITIRKVNGADTTDYGPYLIFSQGDPLLRHQWFINNTGQKAFADFAGLSGEDLNVIDAWRTEDASSDLILGDDIKIAVSDTGVEIEHQDLRDNIRKSANRDYSSGVPDVGGDPTNNDDSSGDHGTSVAGLIGAEGWNGVGGRGVAPNASISGINFLNSSQSTALLVDQIDGDFDIFNQSWGDTDSQYNKLPGSYTTQMVDSTSNGRSGLGQIIVRAAGNSFVDSYNSTSGQYWSRPSTSSADNNVPYVIVVGATSAGNTGSSIGEKASYSSAGSNIWVSAPGGEFGDDDPAMVTTDQAGCDKGYARTGATTNSFQQSSTSNKKCNYTSTFNGTSSAAPVLSGLIALILQANPSLTWRDVKHILANTSDQIDAAWPGAYASLFRNRSWDPATYQYEQAWITNSAGYKFHNWYGFGRANAKAAVDMAKTYAVNLGTFTQYDRDSATSLGVAIPDNTAAGGSTTLVADAGAGAGLVIEAVTVQLEISHTWVGDLAVELTAPSGTKSILFNINNSFQDAHWTTADKVVFLSNAFYGETSDGTWTLKVIDGAAGDVGTLNSWKMKIYGH